MRRKYHGGFLTAADYFTRETSPAEKREARGRARTDSATLPSQYS